MSDFSLNLDDGFFNSESVSDEKRSDKVTKVVKIIVAILIFALFLEIMVYKFIVPSQGVPRVNISGNNFYSSEEIAGYLRSMNCTSFYDFDVDSALSILCSVPGIKDAEIKKVFPDKIYISIEERKPVSVIFANIDGVSKPLQIDDEGVLFPEKVKIDEGKVPIISGIPVEFLGAGMRIPEKYRSLLNQIEMIASLPGNYFQSISEICVLPKEYGNYELVLFPINTKIKILTDNTLNEDLFKYIVVSLNVAKTMYKNISLIELRGETVSFK